VRRVPDEVHARVVDHGQVHGRERLLFKNAQGFYDDPSKANEEQFPARQSVINKPKNARNRLSVISATQKAPDWLNRGAAKQVGVLHRGAASMRQLDSAPPTPKFLSLTPDEIEHRTIDTHLHMLDFLQKSSGTRTILEAMDGCGCDKAVLIGMPCCKKWSKDEPEEPLYYQDDNGQLYVYSYCDQMIADAWLALPDDKRKRFAPVMASFNPTDINSINHVERMWNKYPGMWRGIGEVMCRHDDLTTLLQENETPCMNHVALEPMYEFCVKHGLNCMMHQNADRTAKVESNGFYEYQFEMEQVLEKFPELKLVWCHAGVSRRTFEPNHHEMLDELMDKYPNLTADISWVVWELTICGEDGVPKPGWVDLFEKYPDRFTIGSDQVGQFIGPGGQNWLKPEIVKYWTLAKCLTPETCRKILYENAERIWFDGWEIPSSDDVRFRQIPPTMRCETLWMNEGKFVVEDELF